MNNKRNLVTSLSVLFSFPLVVHATVPASYDLVPLPVEDAARNNFAASIDNTGLILTALQQEFNPPIDIERLASSGIYDNPNFPLTAPDDVRNGIFNDQDYSTVVGFLLSLRGNTFVQQLATFTAYAVDANSFTYIPGFDEEKESLGGFSKSVVSILHDSLDGDTIVGTGEGFFRDIEFTNANGTTLTYTINDFLQRGFVQKNGVTIALPPEDTTLGGISQARDINRQYQVAGFGTVSFLDGVQSAIDTCNDDESRGDQPVEVCLRNIRINQSTFEFRSQIRPIIWQLDASGNLISATHYPLVFTPDEDNTTHFNGHAYAINDNGVAVGQSQTGVAVPVVRPGGNFPQLEAGSVATIYENGVTTEFLDRDVNLQSIALDINNNGIVVGNALKTGTSGARQQMFIYNKETQDVTYRYGFFNGSSVNVQAINNNNIVVGRAEVEATNDLNREVHAFMYIPEQDELVNLNNMISCNSPYVLVDAVDINDNNEIVASARIVRTRKHASGNNALDSDGNTQNEDNIVAVRLVPSSEARPDSCDVTAEEPFERSGAGMSIGGLLLMLLAGVRRRAKSAQ